MDDDKNSWVLQAACRGMGDTPEGIALFYPDRGEDQLQVMKLCASCSVREECLEDALSMPQTLDFGIRGGLSDRRRDQLRWARNRQRAESA